MYQQSRYLIVCILVFVFNCQITLSQNIDEMADFILNVEHKLRSQYNYKGAGFKKPVYWELSDRDFYSGVKKFKEALENTKFLRDFKNIDTIYIYPDNYAGDIEMKSDRHISLYIPTHVEAAEIIPAISTNPDKESVYQQFLLNKKTKLDQNLKDEWGSMYKYHKLAQSIACDDKILYQTNDQERIHHLFSKEKEVERKNISNIEFSSGSSHQSNIFNATMILHLYPRPPEKITLSTFINPSGQKEKTLIQIDDTNKNLMAAYLDSNCSFLWGKIWGYDKEDYNRVLFQKTYNKTGEVKNVIYANREISSLEDIYAHCSPSQFDEILDLVARVDRILLTILDSGVDYNQRKIAYKIHNIPLDESSKEALNRKQKRITEEINTLKDILSNLTGIQSSIDLKESLAKLVFLEQELKDISIGWDFDDNDHEPYDFIGNFEKKNTNHGTSVAGIAVYNTDDIAILPVRARKEEHFYDAIDYAYRQGSRIVNISLGSKQEMPYLKKAIEDHPDMLFVIAAGNISDSTEERDLDNNPYYPASYEYPNMLVVTSVDDNNHLSTFARYSKTKVHAAVQGEEILSLFPENTEGYVSGTSFAAPYVSKICAQIQFINPRLTPRQIIAIIRESIDPQERLKHVTKYGGTINETKAFQLANDTILNQ